jgi:hypothetical protein
MVSSPDPLIHLNGLRLAVWVARGVVFHRNGRFVVPAKAPEHLADFWDGFACQNAKSYAADIAAAASCDEGMLYASLRHRFHTAGHFLTTTGSDLTPLFTAHRAVIFDALWTPYLEYLGGAAARAWGRAVHSGLPAASEESMTEDFTAVGRFLIGHPEPPWLSICLSSRYEVVPLFSEDFAHPPALFRATNPTTYLGIAATILIITEMTRDRILPADSGRPLGTLSDLYPYILRRWDYDQDAQLPELPVPEDFQHLFNAWANKTANFIRPATEPHP